MNICKIFLNPKEEKEILQGYPWVFDNEISFVKSEDSSGKLVSKSLNEAKIENGSLVDVYTKSGVFLGAGVFNRNSKIIIRLIGNIHSEEILADKKSYWSKIVSNAVNIRRLNYEENDSYRLIFAEADFIPGLIVERYVDYSDSNKVYLVVQFLAMACEVFRDEIISSLIELCSPFAIYERSDASVREKEGLPLLSGWIYKQGKEVLTILENEIKLEVDIANGQKTGYFLDQKFNRKRVAEFCKGKKVLDTFTHTGAFGLNAAFAGAKKVISVDISSDAVAMVNKNISLNGFSDKMEAIQADVFDLLKHYEEQNEKFDVIILDPPAFTKVAKSIQKAYSGYKEINLRAMRLLNDGGILVTCSCSHYFDSNTFYSMIMHAAKDSHKKVQVLEKRGAGPDHPVLLGYTKSEYLKCAICRVL